MIVLLILHAAATSKSEGRRFLSLLTNVMARLCTYCSDGGSSSAQESPLPSSTFINTNNAVTGASFEAHAVLALELGARVILANRSRVVTLWPFMHAHVQRVLANQRWAE